METKLNYVGGEWCGNDLPMLEVVNPATGAVIAHVPRGGRELATAAVEAAYGAFADWRARTAYERADLLMKWHALIEEEIEDCARTMTIEQGKPLKESLGEMRYANGFISWYAEEGKRIYGETIPAGRRDKRLSVHRQPVGVVAVITPWNFPAAMITRKIGPALAAGCTVVIKPAGQTPLTAIKLVELAERVGFPPGVINLVTGSAREIGSAWLADERVRKLTFTGSTEVGRELMKGSADTVKRISLELGGHAPAIVMAEANLERAADAIVAAKFRNSGQTCICVNRIYVQAAVHDAFVEIFAKKVSALKVGDGLAAGTDLGPLIDQAAVDKVRAHIAQAVEAGARVETGGKPPQGLWMEPTVLTSVRDEMDCMKEETFGPLAPIASFETSDEVIRRANASIYGLAAYVFTENINDAFRLVEALDYGIIGLNDGGPSTPQAPFGGMKQSGIGREGGRQGMEEYLEIKYVSLLLS